MTDCSNLTRVIQEVRPDEVYNLAARSTSRCPSSSPNTPPMSMASARSGCSRRSGSSVSARPCGFIRRRRRSSTDRSPRFLKLDPRPSTRGRPSGGEVYASWIPRQLPRGLWFLRLQWNPVQPRDPDPRRDFVTRKITRAPRPIAGRPGLSLPRQPQRQARLGPQPRLCRGAVADAPAGEARRLRHRHRRAEQRPRIRHAGRREPRHRHCLVGGGRRRGRQRGGPRSAGGGRPAPAR